MTEKKAHILTISLKLFAKNGFNSTSTNKIAKEAKVSEGLIFRHFGNKEGLLKSIIEVGKEKASLIFDEIEQIKNPSMRLKAVLDIPFDIPENDYSFWKLLYALKWQAEQYDHDITGRIKKLLTETFKSLNYPEPEAETEIILMLFDGIATAILLKKLPKSIVIQKNIYKKFNIQE